MSTVPIRGRFLLTDSPQRKPSMRCSLYALILPIVVLASPLQMHAQERRTLDEILASKITFEFQQDSLERAAAALVAKVRKKGEAFEVKLIGKDLQLEGITKNQTIRNFHPEDKTVAEILTALILKANPN